MTTPRTTLSNPQEAARLARNSFRMALIILVALVLADIASFGSALQGHDWRLYAQAGLVLAAGLITCISLMLIRRGKANLGIWLMLGGLFAMVIVVNVFLVSGRGALTGLIVATMTILIANHTLPASQVPRALYAGIIVGVTTLSLDLFGPATRLASRDNPMVLIATAVVAIVFLGMYTVRQFTFLSLRTKFIIAFVLVALVPLGSLGFLNDYNTRNLLIKNASQSLLTAASETAVSIDTFFNTRLDTLVTEAKLPVLVQYLELPGEKRSGSAEEKEAAAVLNTLRSKDEQNILFYALLDGRGRIMLDTLLPDIGEDYSTRDFFRAVLRDNQPYVSSIQFYSGEEAALYLAAPVQRPASGEMIGMLLMRYNARFLQDLIASKNGLAGPASFAILADENHLRLGDGSTRDSIYKTIMPLEPAEVKRLQAARRLPPRTIEQLSTQLPKLEGGLQKAAKVPVFEAEAEITETPDESLEQMAVAQLKTQPWLVAFAQPQSVFLAPVQVQTRNALMLSLLIAGLSIVVAAFASQLMAGPITRLTTAAQKVAAGDLTVRAEVSAQDEIGELTRTFNTMTGQLQELVGSLESQVKQRTAQLSASAEVGRAVSSILDVPTLLSAVVNLISDRFGYYYTAVFMLDESGQYAVLQEATGEAGRVLKEHGHRLEARETSMVGSAISTGRPRIALHAETEATRFVNPLLPDTRSEIALPLRLGGRVIGALDVQSVQPNAFDEASASVLQSMADAIAVSLGNARLYTEVQQRAKQQEGLARIAALSGSTLTVDELLNQLMAEARQLLGAEITVALLKDEARQALVGRHIAGEGAPTPAAETWFVPLNAPGFEQGIFARGGNYYSNKAPDDPNIIPAYRPYMEALQVRNFCGVALRVRDQSLGELYVANRASGFGRNDIALLQTIAGYAANAIQNARLFEETQRLAVREQMINAMTARIRSGLTLEDALQATVQEVGQRLSAGRVAVRLKLAQEPSSRGNGHGNETS